MKIAELKKDSTQLHVKVTYPAKDINILVDKKLANVAKTAKMDGFRVGKVPASILKRKYSASLNIDIARDKITESINKCIKDKKLNTATDPEVTDLKNEEGENLEFTLKFELLPEIELPDFKKIAIEKSTLKVEKKDVEEQIKKLAEFSKSYEKETKVKCKKGDQVTIDAVGYVDGKAFDGGKLDAHKLVLGSATFIPGFEDQLIGSKAGDEVDVKVDFPKDYHATELAGKPSEFKTKIIAVHKESETKIDDEFAKKFKCESLEEFKKQISQNIEGSYDEPIHVMMKMQLFDKLEKSLKFDVPESLIAKEIDALKRQTEQFGEEDDSLKGKSKADQEKYFKELANRRVRIGLVLAEYTKQKDIKIDEDDIRQAIISQARNFPGQEKQVAEFYQKDRNALESLKGPILEEKAVQKIFDDEVILSKKTYTKDKLEKLIEKENQGR